MNISHWLANKLLAHQFGRVTHTPTATLKVRAMTVAPTAAGGGTEVAGAGYAPVVINNSTSVFSVPASGQQTTLQAFSFPQAGADWGTVVALKIDDENDNFLCWAPLVTPRTISSGSVLEVSVGDLDLTLS